MQTMPRNTIMRVSDFVSSSSDEFPEAPEEGIYTLELTAVGEPETRDNPFYDPSTDKPDKQTQTQITLDFEVRDDEVSDGYRVRHWANYTLWQSDDGKRRSALRAIVNALNGRDLDDDDEVELSNFVGTRIMAKLIQKTSGKGTVFGKLVPESCTKIKTKRKVAAAPQPVTLNLDEPGDGDHDDPFL